jgi:diaminohydroxyphosphoribosylaminopyrimidine deaminase/5-amino-6-(5-phosphoribosylamino)uracil reductase
VRVDLIGGLMEEKAKEINKRFFTFHVKKRPYVILKWAQTGDRFVATSPDTLLQERGNVDPHSQRLIISNEYSNRLVHKWRSEEAAILVGTNTATMDDPELTNRLWSGNSPIRLVIDFSLKLHHNLKIFKGASPTIIFNSVKHDINENESSEMLKQKGGVRYYKLDEEKTIPGQLVSALHEMKIISILVEGGPTLHQTFINEGMWDECRVITNSQLLPAAGLRAPVLVDSLKVSESEIVTDKLVVYAHNKRRSVL